jgi:hypothetical protein
MVSSKKINFVYLYTQKYMQKNRQKMPVFTRFLPVFYPFFGVFSPFFAVIFLIPA